ncbi:MAG: type II toxin-antitoxin system HicB family antitoxin [Dehalococcoidia bacterium]|nr:type II toxin-antitoxin system HicB family antitoxin [Dehalococcoidia bacterium]
MPMPGCLSAGLTIDETRKNIAEAIELYLESLREDGLPIPQGNSDVHVEQLTIPAPA